MRVLIMVVSNEIQILIHQAAEIGRTFGRLIAVSLCYVSNRFVMQIVAIEFTRRMYKFRKTVIDYPHKTCIMKGAIDDVMNVANGTKVLLIDTFVNYFHVPSRGLPRRKISGTSSKGERHRRRECRADEYTFDRLVIRN